MTGVYILILAIITLDGHALTTAEFKNKESCEAAGTLAVTKMQPQRYGKLTYICVEKQK